MTRQLALSDFRAIRVVLEPDDFALGGDEPDPPPTDLITEKTWHGIMDLPDDVAIRTSDRTGQVLGEVYWLWGRWIEAVGETDDALFVPMLDAHDDLQASFFDSLHGYYRTAFSALRNVIELMTIGACGALAKTPLYKEWRNGSTEFKFGTACDLLSKEPSLSAFNESMRNKEHQSLWDAKRVGLSGGMADAFTAICVTLRILAPDLLMAIFDPVMVLYTSPRYFGTGTLHISERLLSVRS